MELIFVFIENNKYISKYSLIKHFLKNYTLELNSGLF